MTTSSTVLVTGASTGIGATYAERFAARGHDLVIVARDQKRLESLATSLRDKHRVSVDVLPADLTHPNELAVVEKRLADDAGIDTLINNAGIAQSGSFVEQKSEDIDRLVTLNTTVLTKLAGAIAPRLAQAGHGAIVNISSIVGLAPEFGMAVYGATKAFVLFLSQGLSLELTPKGVYIQAVLPAATRTKLWERAGIDVDKLPAVMEVGELVDAALVGFDRRESVTIPPLQDAANWEGLEVARRALLQNVKQSESAARYRTTGQTT
ncbi:SDR family oxidoreductase [Burkholderia sp. Ac-20384]|uniref:SDR family NAD(P)-dependent oxidoreductase n=1 Tax=Burkholderia sp. Ac-20384 TaxID=2703902 RepID=UPI00197FB3D0|nr:SDR family oxidoreductase [Burkholderia sp. Ac-20384]MBN3829394.1 SDR family oxidoreductase [Burkholderia sp. Ac-20384]